MAKSKMSYSAKLNLELKGLDKLKNLQKKIKDTPNMGEGVKKEFAAASKEFDSTMRKVEQRIKSGNFDFSDLGIEEQIKELERITTKRVGSIKGGITKKDTDVAGQQKVINKLEKEYKSIDDTIEKARIEVTKFENEGQKLKKRFNIDTTDIETINRKIEEQQKLIASEPKGGKAKQDAIKEASRLKKAREAAKEYNQELSKKNAIVDGYISKRDKVYQTYKKEQQVKDQMHQERMKDISDPAVESAEQMRARLRNLSLGSREVKQEKQKKEAKAKSAKTTKQLKAAEKSHNDTITDKITNGIKYYVVLNQLRRLYTSLIRTVSEFDEAMTTVAMVSSMNRDEVWDLSEAYKELGDQVGMAATEVAELSIYFFRQGRSAQDALEMTRVAAESARVASIDATESANYLTSAINGFELAASDAEGVADRFAKLGAASASSYDELARAMSKVAPSAKSAGVDIDHMMGFLAKGIETTREAPQNIGTAFKTIFARMQELTDFGKTLEDGVNVNRVEKALDTVGVKLRDTMGIFRPAQEIVMDLGAKWGGLNRNMQSYLATIMAGIRQQPRLLALMNNFSRTQELVATSQEAAGEMAIQHASYLEGLEGSVERLKNAWTGFIDSISSSEIIITVVDMLRKGINRLTSVMQWFGEGGTVMVTAVTAMTAAIAVSQIQLIKNTASTIKNIAVKQKQLMVERKQMVVNKIKNRQLKIRNIELNKESAALSRNLKLRKTALNTVGLHYKGAVAGAKAATLSVKGLGLALKGLTKAFLPLLALTVALKAISWVWEKLSPVVGELIDKFKSLNDGAEEFAENIEGMEKELHNLNKEQEQVTDLVEKFDELNNKVKLTEDDLKNLDVLLSNLSKAKIGDIENFTEISASGKLIFDREKYENAIKQNTNVAKELQESQEDELIKAVNGGIVQALEEDATQSIYKRVLFEDATMEFVGLEESVQEQLKRDLDKAITGVDFDMFYLEVPLSVENITSDAFDVHASDFDIENLPIERMREIAAEAGETSISETENSTDFIQAFKGAVMAKSIEMEHILNSYSKDISTILPKALVKYNQGQQQEYDRVIESIEGTVTAEDELTAEIKSLIAGREVAEDVIVEMSDNEEGLYQMLREAVDNKNLETTAINKLRNSYNMEIDAIVSWKSDGASYNEMQKFFDDVQDNIDFNPDMSGAGSLMGVAMSEFENNVKNSAEWMERLTQATNNMDRIEILGEGGLKDEGKFINELFAITHTSLEEITRSMDQTSEEMKRLEDLHESFSKGEASAEALSSVIMDYGEEGMKAIRTGEGFNKLIMERANLTKGELENNKEQYQQALEHADLTDEQRDSMEKQLLFTTTMLENYEQITKLDRQREDSLETINEYLEDAENMHSRASSLRDMGLGEVADVFDSMGDKTLDLGFESSRRLIQKDTMELKTLNNQLAGMEGAVKEDGIWKYSGDDEEVDGMVSQYNAQMDQVEESIDQYIELYEYEEKQLEDQLKETNKAIEEQYDERIATMKEAHDQRWNEIEYQSDLKESNQDILNIRRRISALSRQDSRASKAKLQEEEKAMKDAQRKRQKMIEKEIMEQEIKVQEDAKEEQLRQAEVANTEAINNLTGAIDRLIGAITPGSGETDGPDAGENTATDRSGNTGSSRHDQNLGLAWQPN